MALATTGATFHPFPRLPLELRLKIWRSSLPGPRLIRISVEDGSFKSNTPHPLGLQICKESREETLRIYQLSIAVEPSKNHIYINTDHDGLLLLSPSSDDYHSTEFIANLKRFTTANYAIKNDIKVVCLGYKHTRPAPRAALFGPNCRLFYFTNSLNRERHLAPWNYSSTRAEDLFGTKKLRIISGYDWPVYDPPRTPPARDFIKGFGGFGDIVRQFVESSTSGEWYAGE